MTNLEILEIQLLTEIEKSIRDSDLYYELRELTQLLGFTKDFRDGKINSIEFSKKTYDIRHRGQKRQREIRDEDFKENMPQNFLF